MTPVGFEPTQLALVELESTPLDHSGASYGGPFGQLGLGLPRQIQPRPKEFVTAAGQVVPSAEMAKGGGFAVVVSIFKVLAAACGVYTRQKMACVTAAA
jgi:hypothetical protein